MKWMGSEQGLSTGLAQDCQWIGPLVFVSPFCFRFPFCVCKFFYLTFCSLHWIGHTFPRSLYFFALFCIMNLCCFCLSALPYDNFKNLKALVIKATLKEIIYPSPQALGYSFWQLHLLLLCRDSSNSIKQFLCLDRQLYNIETSPSLIQYKCEVLIGKINLNNLPSESWWIYQITWVKLLHDKMSFTLCIQIIWVLLIGKCCVNSL